MNRLPVYAPNQTQPEVMPALAPSGTTDYEWDFRPEADLGLDEAGQPYLEDGETIAMVSVDAPAELGVGDAVTLVPHDAGDTVPPGPMTIGGDRVVVWLFPLTATLGLGYIVTLKFRTSAGRTSQRSIRIEVAAL